MTASRLFRHRKRHQRSRTTMPSSALAVALLTLIQVADYEVVAQEFAGDGTSYTLSPPSSGNCNFMTWPEAAVNNYVAMNDEQYDNGHACGRCVEVWCTDPQCSSHEKELVYVMDRCPECKKGDLDLSPTVYKKITGHDPHRLKIAWLYVDCPVDGNMKICLKEGSNPFWTALQPTNLVTGVQSMLINGRQPDMVPSAYYYKVETNGGMDLGSVKLAITSVAGETVETTVSVDGGGCVATDVQFGRGGGGGGGGALVGTHPPETPEPPSTPDPTTPRPAPTESPQKDEQETAPPTPEPSSDEPTPSPSPPVVTTEKPSPSPINTPEPPSTVSPPDDESAGPEGEADSSTTTTSRPESTQRVTSPPVTEPTPSRITAPPTDRTKLTVTHSPSTKQPVNTRTSTDSPSPVMTTTTPKAPQPSPSSPSVNHTTNRPVTDAVTTKQTTINGTNRTDSPIVQRLRTTSGVSAKHDEAKPTSPSPPSPSPSPTTPRVMILKTQKAPSFDNPKSEMKPATLDPLPIDSSSFSETTKSESSEPHSIEYKEISSTGSSKSANAKTKSGTRYPLATAPVFIILMIALGIMTAVMLYAAYKAHRTRMTESKQVDRDNEESPQEHCI